MSTDQTTTDEQLARRMPSRVSPLAFVALAVLGISVWMAVRPSDGYVKQILVTKRAPVPDLNDTPDLYLQIETANISFRTEAYNNKRIGNGLSWVLPTPVRASEIRSIELWDADFVRPDQLDRVNVVELQEQGELYHFQIISREPAYRPFAIVAAVASGVYCAAVIMKFARDQAI